MSGPTGVLDVVTGTGTERYEWNGDPVDRAKARAAFNRMMSTGAFLAVIHDEPRKSHQIRTFDEIEQVEMERGVVAAQVGTALVGG